MFHYTTSVTSSTRAVNRKSQAAVVFKGFFIACNVWKDYHMRVHEGTALSPSYSKSCKFRLPLRNPRNSQLEGVNWVCWQNNENTGTNNDSVFSVLNSISLGLLFTKNPALRPLQFIQKWSRFVILLTHHRIFYSLICVICRCFQLHVTVNNWVSPWV